MTFKNKSMQMTFNSNIKIYLILFFFIILGYVFMVIPDIFLPPPTEGEFNEQNNFAFQISVLALVVLTNFVTAYKFKLKRELSNFWSIKRIIYFPVGLMIGVFIMSIPIAFGILYGEATWSDLKFDYGIPGLKPVSIIFVLIITLWEELWFRGIFLNYAKRYLPILKISLFLGFLFMISYSFIQKEIS